MERREAFRQTGEAYRQGLESRKEDRLQAVPTLLSGSHIPADRILLEFPRFQVLSGKGVHVVSQRSTNSCSSGTCLPKTPRAVLVPVTLQTTAAQ